MLAYVLINESEFIQIISSKILELNTINKSISTKMPQLNTENMAIKFNLMKSEKRDLLKQRSGIYYLNRAINLEGRNFKFLFNDVNQLDYFKRLNLIYKEIKITDENSNLYYIKYLKESAYNFFNLKKDDLLQEYEVVKNSRVNKIKGMLYGISSESNIQSYILDNYSSYFKELNQIISLMNNLRTDKKLDRELYDGFLKLRKSLERKVIKSVNQLNKETLIFEINEKKEIIFKDLFIDSSFLEKDLFEIVINKIIDFNEKVSEKDVLMNVIIEIDKMVKVTPRYHIFLEDLRLILDRVLEKNYDTDVENIQSILLKNLYATYIKLNNLQELYSFLNEKAIEKNFFSMAFYGAVKGFMGMPRSSVLKLDNDKWAVQLINESLRYVENQYYSLENNNIYTKNKLYYLLNNIIIYLEDKRQYKLPYADVFISKREKGYCLNIKTEYYGEMVVRFYPRVQNIAKSISYFDNKIERVKKTYNNFQYNNLFYFQYYFKNNSKTKISNLSKEYIFAILLKEIFYVVKGVKSYGE